MSTRFDLTIVGAGIAGLVCALESLKLGKKVLIIDAQPRENMGGLARVAFGGMALVDTPEQKSKNITDSPELAYKDWCSYADFDETDYWPKQWAKFYVENSISEIYEYVKTLNTKFLPAVNWVERGLYVPGNTVPRYHILWGCSLRLVEQLKKQLSPYEGKQLSYCFDTKVTGLIKTDNAIVGCKSGDGTNCTEHYSDNLVIACGGFTGNIEEVSRQWPKNWKPVQPGLLNGTHPSNDGALHQEVNIKGGQLSNMHNMWNYPAGLPNPNAEFNNHGLSLIPSRSALWVDHKGKRIGPQPLVANFDTRYICKQINELELPHSWQILNERIALKELAISGSEHNTSIRDRKFFTMLKDLIFGNKKLLSQMLKESDHFIIADDLKTLTQKMNELTPEHLVSTEILSETVNSFDQIVRQKEALWNDDQLRRLLSLRQWGTDRLRTCYPKPLTEHGPLIAIKLNLITRKCLGGIKTDLECRVLNDEDKPLQGLFAIGEAAGFGGGGANGKRSLEGTFLSGCILTARQAARSI